MEPRPTGQAQLYFRSDSHTAQQPRHIRTASAWEALLDEAVSRACRLALLPARQLAATCTTGRLDRIHGELWLLPDALVRVRSGPMDSVANSLGGSGVTGRSPYRHVAYDPAAILAAHRTNKVIALADIAEARLDGGVTPSPPRCPCPRR
ncbi:hypothetical protein [Streptomyces gilvus]|uniref:hypothetical protein n=1 Tax=Streptomyces gilvus TaxID=2920937 RepID=UPI001F0DEDA3|nr:hypothetical protein [Streptomyces sp. CME 23]MCH5673558.1 hypothetical protein [Streptomyces sp. CME 23]